MLLSEIRDRVLVETGNLFLADLSMLGITASQFLTLTRNSLGYWSKYRFHKGQIIISPEGNNINFSVLRQRYIDYVNAKARGENPTPVPVVTVIPTFITNVMYQKYGAFFDNQTLSYQYDKPLLKIWGGGESEVIIEYQDDFAITEVGIFNGAPTPASVGSTTMPSTKGTWNPNVIPSTTKPREVVPSAPEDELTKWEIQGLEDAERLEEFISYLSAKFMIALGRSRRSFQLSESPIQLDGGELVSEGQELEQRMIEQIQETSDVYDTLLEVPRAGW